MTLISSVALAKQLKQPEPTTQQQAVIEAPLSPALVVAGAGSGKTETMANRVVWLVANGMVHPDEILGLTFTRKAAASLNDRITKRVAALCGENQFECFGNQVAVKKAVITARSTRAHAYAGSASCRSDFTTRAKISSASLSAALRVQ